MPIIKTSIEIENKRIITAPGHGTIPTAKISGSISLLLDSLILLEFFKMPFDIFEKLNSITINIIVMIKKFARSKYNFLHHNKTDD